MSGSIQFIALAILVGVAVFVATIMILGTGYGLITGRQLLFRRLQIGGSGTEGAALTGASKIETSLAALLGRLPWLMESNDQAALRAWLARAGYRTPNATHSYNLARASCTIGAITLVALLLPIIGSKLHLPEILGIIVLAILGGYMLPPYWVQRRVQTRRQEAELGFPDTLDMLLVCVEAGHGLDQSLTRVATEMRLKAPILSQELLIVSDELRAGKDRSQVMRDFADRINVDDVSAFITILNQSDQYGVSIGDALRVYASEMRNKRIMKAEEKANTMPVKVALGTIFFTVPPVMLIMAGPSIMMLLRAFATMTRPM